MRLPPPAVIVLRVVGALVLPPVACAPAGPVHPRALEEVSRGYRYLADHDLERAEVAFAHALELRADLPEALNGAGVVERRRERLDAAERWFERAVRADPDFAEGHVNLGELALARGRPDEADARFRAALRIDPDLVVARLDRARALLHRGRFEERGRAGLWAAARREYLHLLESRPDLPEAHHDLGWLALAGGDAAGAAAAYGRAAALAPDYVEAIYGLCVASARLGRCADAANACERCAALPDVRADRCRSGLRGALACGDGSPLAAVGREGAP